MDPTDKPRKISIIDIARMAGCSPSTVSNTLNGKGRSSEKTRRRVLALCQKHSYSPNSAARNLRLRKTETVGVMFYPTCAQLFRNVFYAEVMEALEEHLEKAGYDVLLAGYTNVARNSTPRFIRQGKVDGIVLLGNYPENIIDEIHEYGVPMLLLDSNSESLSIDSITTNGTQACINIVDYLHQQGHSKIAFLAYKHTDHNTERRIKGYKTGLKRAGIDTDNNLIIRTDHDDAFKSLEPLLKNDRVTAVLCENDHLAARLQSGLLNNGYKLPDTLSIFGFDNNAYSNENGISTVDVNRHDIGKKGAETILKRIQTPQADVVSIDLGTELIHRDTVRNLG